jgi:lantibiotic transport system permease protein
MSYLVRALRAEVLKLRRTPSLLIVLAGPLVINIIFLLIVGAQASRTTDVVRSNPWGSLIGSVDSLWIMFMYPLVIVTVTALWANFEHHEQLWQHLFALPVPRVAIYAAKWVLSMLLVAVSTLLLGVFNVLAGLLLRVALPRLGFGAPAPVGMIFGHLGVIFLAAVLMVTIHTWVSLRWQNLFVALGAGVAALVANLFISFSPTWSRFFPWSLPLRVHAIRGANPVEAVLVSILGALIVGAVCGYDLVRREHV